MNMSGENDGLGGSVSSAASMTCCVFFAVIYDAGDYSILSAYRACRDARRRVETGVSPIRKGGVGGIPPTFARTRATDSSHTSHRLLGGVSRPDFLRSPLLFPPAAGKYASGAVGLISLDLTTPMAYYQHPPRLPDIVSLCGEPGHSVANLCVRVSNFDVKQNQN